MFANAQLLTDITEGPPTTFRGISGSVKISTMGTFQPLGVRTHLDPTGHVNILSASKCSSAGYRWAFIKGSTTDDDVIELYLPNLTMYFWHKHGLYVARMSPPPVAFVTTVESNEAQFSKREVARSAASREFQKALGCIPDAKLIENLRNGTFTNCPHLPEDVSRATKIWGPCTSGIKGRTVKAKISFINVLI